MSTSKLGSFNPPPHQGKKRRYHRIPQDVFSVANTCPTSTDRLIASHIPPLEGIPQLMKNPPQQRTNRYYPPSVLEVVSFPQQKSKTKQKHIILVVGFLRVYSDRRADSKQKQCSGRMLFPAGNSANLTKKRCRLQLAWLIRKMHCKLHLTVGMFNVNRAISKIKIQLRKVLFLLNKYFLKCL